MRAKPGVVLIPLAGLFLTSGLVQAWRDSPTVDEAVDVASGVTSLVRHTLWLNPEHGILFRLTAAAPALFAHPVVPRDPAYRTNDWFGHTDAFIRANQAAGRLHLVIFLARLVPLAEGLLIALLLYVVGSRLFGTAAGTLAAGLWLTTPVVLGLSHVVSIDIAFTLAVLVVALTLLNHLESPGFGSATVVGLALGAALLVRHDALILVAVAAVVVGCQAGRSHAIKGVEWAVATGVTSWLAVWVFIRGIVFSSPGGPAGASLSRFIADARHQSTLARVVLSLPWPKEWAAGFSYLVVTNTPRPAYLLGRTWTGSAWWYFPGSLVAKVPEGLVLALLLGPVAWVMIPGPARRKGLLVVVAPAVAVFAPLVFQSLNLGLRYAFPVLALLLIAAAPAALAGRHLIGRIALVLLAATQVAAMVWSYPHSIAWMPPPFRPAYRWVTDSNVDYGQDEGALARWAAGKQPLLEVLLPRGVDLPAGSRSLLSVPTAAIQGWVAVSPTYLTELDRDRLSWLRAYCPVGTIDGNIVVYYFKIPPDERPGPVQPAPLCPRGPSVRTRA